MIAKTLGIEGDETISGEVHEALQRVFTKC
jgi:hypothetical protein